MKMPFMKQQLHPFLVIVFVRRPKKETKSSNLLTWPPAVVKTLHNPGTLNFFEEAAPTDNSPWEWPKSQRAKRGLPKATPLLATREPVVKKARIQKPSEPPLMYVALDLPLVTSMLINTKYVANLLRSPVVNTLISMGVKEMAQRVTQIHTCIAGRLRLFTPNWQVITKDPWVINCVQGYTIDLVGQPHQTHPPVMLKFPQSETESLSMEVQKMVAKQVISQVPHEEASKGFKSQLFSVPKKDGGMRPIINLKGLNTYVETVHFKMEGIHMLKDTLKPGDWMTKVDLKDAYFMVPIAPHHRPLLRFQWQGKTYQFNCLPFGLSSAPWVFTKTTRPIVATLRSIGLRMIIYIDDMLIMAPSPTVAREHTAGLIFLLENLGFIINHPKSVLTPTQEILFLGFTISSTTMEIRLPGDKIKQIRQDARKLLDTQYPQALALSRLLGKLNHAAQAIPPAPLFYRNLQLCLQSALGRTSGGRVYSVPVQLTPAAVQELQWWQEHLTIWNGHHLLTTPPDMVIETDASTTGWGALCHGMRTGGPWSWTESQMHINCLELLAESLAIKSFTRGKKNVHIHLKMDNTTALTYINKYGGTASPELNQLT